MDFNLALILMSECIKMSVGESGKPFRLAWFKKCHDIPNDTYYRHVNSLIKSNFITRISRDKYELHSLFIYRMSKVIHAIEERRNIAYQQNMFDDDIPF